MSQPETDFSAPTRPNVLLVDDDPAILRILSTWLEKAGYNVRRVGSGELALAAIEAECPDFLITDWHMPTLSGLELCRQVRQLKLPHYVHILFLSVKLTAAEMVEGLEVGVNDFLSKPVYRGELLARLKAGERTLDMAERIRESARTDAMTGLMTRTAFHDVLEKEWQRSKRFHLPLSCVAIDLDFFKRVNDAHGYPAGDTIIKAIAALLSNCARGGDSVCRCGGEEFYIMLPETNEHGAAAWAEKTREELTSLSILNAGRQVRVTASFGTAGRHDDTRNAAQLMDQAEQALACAKQWGHDQVVRYELLDEENDLDLDRSDSPGGLFQGVTAGQVMTPLTSCFRDTQTVGQAAEYLLHLGVNAVPIVDADGKLVGIVSEKDLLSSMVVFNCWHHPVREVMKHNVTCFDEDAPIQAIYKFICRVSIRRVIIVKNGRPTGTISRRTLLRWFTNSAFSRGALKKRAGETTETPESGGRGNRFAEIAQNKLAGTTRIVRLAGDGAAAFDPRQPSADA